MTHIALLDCDHAEQLVSLLPRRGAEVRYVYHHDFARAEHDSRRLNASATSELGPVLDDLQVKVVVIGSFDRREELVLAAAAARKHVYLYSPFGMSVAEAYNMAEAIDQAGVLFQTTYHWRYRPDTQFLYAQIQAGSFGTLTNLRHTTWTNAPRTAAQTAEAPKWRMGIFGRIGIHSLDILLWLGGDVASVTATTGVTGHSGDLDDFGEGLLRFESGAVGSLGAGWAENLLPTSQIVVGTEGYAHIAAETLYFKSNRGKGADGDKPWRGPIPYNERDLNLLLLAAAGHPTNMSLITAREVAVRTAVLEAMYEGARSGTWVTPREGD